MLPTLAGCGSIDVRQLTRIYEPASRDKRKSVPARTALDAVDLSIPPGEVHGLLGPNGARRSPAA